MDISKIFAFGKRRAFITTDNSIYFSGLDFSLNILHTYVKILTFENKIESFSMGNGHSLILDGRYLLLV